MKKHSVFIISAVVGCIMLLSYIFSNINDFIDRNVWSELRPLLVDEKIASIQLMAKESIILSPEEKTQVIRLIRNAKFKKSNRIGEGPTAEAIFIVKLTDGKSVSFGFWGGDTFETSPRFISSETQFLVRSQPLGDWINRRLK